MILTMKPLDEHDEHDVQGDASTYFMTSSDLNKANDIETMKTANQGQKLSCAEYSKLNNDIQGRATNSATYIVKKQIRVRYSRPNKQINTLYILLSGLTNY